jgi:hypothetical protein
LRCPEFHNDEIKTMKAKVLLATAILGGVMSVTLPAAPITGTFNISGTITVTPNTITWALGSSPFTPDKATIDSGATGGFVPVEGTLITIRDLNSATAPVGSTFPQQPFISFDAAPAFPVLNINFIYPGIYTPAACGAAPAVGQNCTLAGSPFSFVNNPPAAPDGPQATATFVFTGLTNDGLERWQGNFTSQFSVPYQQVLNQLNTTGSVTNTFSATFTLSPNTGVPEAGTMSLLGLGLVGLSAKLRRRRKA